MRQQVARDAAPRHLDVETPQPFTALGQVFRNRPILKELGAIVKDAAQPAFANQFLGKDHGGHPAIVVPDHVRHAGLFGGLHDGLRLGGVSAQRLFAKNGFARLGRSDGDLGMGVVGTGNVDDVDILPLDESSPIRLHRFIAPGLLESLGARAIACANRLQNRFVRNIEKVRYPAVSVGVGSPHEAIPDDADV